MVHRVLSGTGVARHRHTVRVLGARRICQLAAPLTVGRGRYHIQALGGTGWPANHRTLRIIRAGPASEREVEVVIHCQIHVLIVAPVTVDVP